MTTKQDRQDVAELAARLAKLTDFSVLSAADAAIELCRIERAQHRHTERDCSDEWYSLPVNGKDGETYSDRTDRRIAARLKRWQKRYGLESATITLAGDPRGAVLKIQLPGASEPVSV